jgi:hypothetical protein
MKDGAWQAPDILTMEVGNAEPFELRDFTVPYIRGQAYLSARKGADAAGIRKILKNQGVDPISPFYPLANIGLAQALALRGDPGAGRREYEAFFELWKDADPDNPILREARHTAIWPG